MPSDAPPTPLEMQLDALASLYGIPAEAVVDLAVRNLVVLAAYQMGAEGAPAERVFALLLAPALTSPQGAQEAPSEPTVWPDPEGPLPPRAGQQHREVLRAAGKMTEPFTSRGLVERYGGSSASVGGILASSGWPSEPPKVGHERRWLPRPS